MNEPVERGRSEPLAWGTRLRARFNYLTPDDEYEAALLDFVGPETEWLDVGCGRQLVHHLELAGVLARRCRRLAGLDPSDNVRDNPYLHEHVQCRLEEWRPDRPFDLVTLRMVAEHITDPAVAIGALRRLVKPDGRVLVLTPWKWSPASVLAAATPMWLHHRIKAVLFECEERDTFPVAYKLNTRADLRQHFEAAGFREESFRFVDDCRSLHRWRATLAVELRLRAALRAAGVRYPEACILASYRPSGA